MCCSVAVCVYMVDRLQYELQCVLQCCSVCVHGGQYVRVMQCRLQCMLQCELHCMLQCKLQCTLQCELQFTLQCELQCMLQCAL